MNLSQFRCHHNHGWRRAIALSAGGLFLLLAQAALASPPLNPQSKAGRALFQQNCSLCHHANQTAAKIGPGLKGLFKSKFLPVSHKPATVANVLAQMRAGKADAKPLPMPSFKDKLSPKELDEIVAYLKTL